MNRQRPQTQRLLKTENFEVGVMPPDGFTILAEELNIQGKARSNVALRAEYDRHLSLRFFLQEDLSFSALTDDLDISISGSGFREPVPLLATSTQFSSGSSGANIEACLTSEPLEIDFHKPITQVEAVLVNAPPLFFSGYEPTFELDDLKISMKEFPVTAKLRKQARHYRHEQVATGSITITGPNGDPIPVGRISKCIGYFANFLTFVRGVNCGIGNATAWENDEIAFALLGFTRTDQFDVKLGWYDIGNAKQLSTIFDHYKSAIAVEEDAFPLLRAIEFYRASNTARDASLEMAVVASHAALETIVPHLLKERAGWSSSLLNSGSAFHDKLRAAATFIGLKSAPDEHAPETQKRSKDFSNADAFQLISLFRNRIVHQGKRFKYSGVELMEVWEMSQWLCEIFIFYFLQYRGVMNDRRRYTGWQGPAVPIPLPAV